MTIRVLLADDQALIRGGFRVLIDGTPDLEIVGEATTGTEAVALARSTRADIVLMDIRMPELDGIAATAQISADEELAGVRVLILTTFELDEYVIRAIRAGASGFIAKSIEPDQLFDAIRIVAGGESLLSPTATSSLIARFTNDPESPPVRWQEVEQLALLTAREREIVTLVGRGLSNDDIAEQLFLSRLTVKTHANRAMMKLNVRDRAQLVVLAYESGLVQPGQR